MSGKFLPFGTILNGALPTDVRNFQIMLFIILSFSLKSKCNFYLYKVPIFFSVFGLLQESLKFVPGDNVQSQKWVISNVFEVSWTQPPLTNDNANYLRGFYNRAGQIYLFRACNIFACLFASNTLQVSNSYSTNYRVIYPCSLDFP